jgi:seryl-tRNA synthetase
MKLQKFFFSKKLPNLLKYAEVKFNYKHFQDNLSLHKTNIINRKVDADADLLVRLYHDYMKKLDDINLMRRHLNSMKDLSSKLARDKKDITQVSKDSKKYQDDITKFQAEQSEIETRLLSAVLKIPNLTHPDSPIGPESNANVIKTIGEPKGNNNDHLEIGKRFDLFDFDNGTKITGSKFVILKNEGALLEQALINWAIDNIRKRGYTFIITPDIAKNTIIEGCGFNPRNKENCKYLIYLELKYIT